MMKIQKYFLLVMIGLCGKQLFAALVPFGSGGSRPSTFASKMSIGTSPCEVKRTDLSEIDTWSVLCRQGRIPNDQVGILASVLNRQNRSVELTKHTLPLLALSEFLANSGFGDKKARMVDLGYFKYGVRSLRRQDFPEEPEIFGSESEINVEYLYINDPRAIALRLQLIGLTRREILSDQDFNVVPLVALAVETLLKSRNEQERSVAALSLFALVGVSLYDKVITPASSDKDKEIVCPQLEGLPMFNTFYCFVQNLGKHWGEKRVSAEWEFNEDFSIDDYTKDLMKHGKCLMARAEEIGIFDRYKEFYRAAYNKTSEALKDRYDLPRTLLYKDSPFGPIEDILPKESKAIPVSLPCKKAQTAGVSLSRAEIDRLAREIGSVGSEKTGGKKKDKKKKSGAHVPDFYVESCGSDEAELDAPTQLPKKRAEGVAKKPSHMHDDFGFSYVEPRLPAVRYAPRVRQRWLDTFSQEHDERGFNAVDVYHSTPTDIDPYIKYYGQKQVYQNKTFQGQVDCQYKLPGMVRYQDGMVKTVFFSITEGSARGREEVYHRGVEHVEAQSFLREGLSAASLSADSLMDSGLEGSYDDAMSMSKKLVSIKSDSSCIYAFDKSNNVEYILFKPLGR